MGRSTAIKGVPLPATEARPFATSPPAAETATTAESKTRFEELVNATAKALLAETSGPFANPLRAVEIALTDKFGLAEFTELTGVGAGDFSSYRVGETGISLRVTMALAGFTEVQQDAIHKAARHLTLELRGMPQEDRCDATLQRNGLEYAPAQAMPEGLPAQREDGASCRQIPIGRVVLRVPAARCLPKTLRGSRPPPEARLGGTGFGIVRGERG